MTEEAADSTKLQKLIDGQGFGQLLTALASSASSQHAAAKNYRVANNKADLEIFSFCVASLHDDAPVVRTQSNSFASKFTNFIFNISTFFFQCIYVNSNQVGRFKSIVTSERSCARNPVSQYLYQWYLSRCSEKEKRMVFHYAHR